ncbi:MAG: Ig-like domain-containing protein [Bacteroidia bacterium]
MNKILSYAPVALLIFFLGSCTSCKKKKDNTDSVSPSVTINTPTANQTFNMFDTIVVSAHVSDDIKLTSVTVSLNDMNNIPVQFTANIPISGKDFSFSIKYVLTEYRLATGNYQISINANDGTNSHQSTRQIFVIESPTVKKGYVIVGASTPKVLTKYDTTFATTGSINISTGFNGMAYGGYNQQLYINGNINQGFQSYNMQAGIADWTMIYNSSGIPQYMGVYTDGQKPYVSHYYGNLLAYSNTGQSVKTFTNNATGYYVSYFNFGSTYDMAVIKDKFGTGPDKIVCYKPTGVANNDNFAPCTIVGIFEKQFDRFYILGNDAANKAVFSLYDVSANTCTPVSGLANGKMLSAVQIDPDFLIFSCSDGNIYGFRYSNNNILPMTGVVAQKLFYHPKMKELTASVKNNLYVYSVSGNYTLNQQKMQVLTDSIIGFEVITNK